MSKITSKIKLISVLTSLSIATVITTTILINNKDKKDAYVINIAGKQRMLTQKISKEILLINSFEQMSYVKLLNDASEFDTILHSLINGNEALGIYPPPTPLISKKLEDLKNNWSIFYEKIKLFADIKKESVKDYTETLKIKDSLEYIKENNEELLNDADDIVALYTSASENRRMFLEVFQYLSGILILFLIVYSIFVIKGIQDAFNNFLEKSKKLANTEPLNNKEIKMELRGDDELAEASMNIDRFLNKIDSLINKSTDTKILAEQISDEISVIIEKLIDDIDSLDMEESEKKGLKKELDRCEDISIQSTEGILSALKMLDGLKDRLKMLKGKKLKSAKRG